LFQEKINEQPFYEEQNNEMLEQFYQDHATFQRIIDDINTINTSLLVIQPFINRKILMNINGIISVENITIDDVKGCISIIYTNTADDIIDDGVIRDDYIFMTRFV
jgi:hypothetical protein